MFFFQVLKTNSTKTAMIAGVEFMTSAGPCFVRLALKIMLI